MKCVSTVSYRFRVNDDLTDVVHPGRGLRQGDPISPYLFLLCAEGFLALLGKVEAEGSATGLCVNHLLFADDSLLLVEATAEGVEKINSILQIYAEGSGQVINREKSSVMFSANARMRVKRRLLLF
jgi:hypothetical protein